MADRIHASGSYSVIVEQPDGSYARGGLVVEPEAMVFRGTDNEGRHVMRRLRYAELTGVRIDRQSSLPADSRTLVLERANREPVRIGVIGAGLLWELADLIARLLGEQIERYDRVIVVVGLRDGMRDQAQALIAKGPPFDLPVSGLDRHEVLLTENSVVFLFEGRIPEVLNRLIQEPELWKEATHWDSCLSGRPELAEVAYSWSVEESAPAAGSPKIARA